MFIQLPDIAIEIWLSTLLLGVPSMGLCLWGFMQWMHPASDIHHSGRRDDNEEPFDGMRFCLFVLLPTVFIWIGILSALPWWLMMILYSLAIALVGIVSMIVALYVDRNNRISH